MSDQVSHLLDEFFQRFSSWIKSWKLQWLSWEPWPSVLWCEVVWCCHLLFTVRHGFTQSKELCTYTTWLQTCPCCSSQKKISLLSGDPSFTRLANDRITFRQKGKSLQLSFVLKIIKKETWRRAEDTIQERRRRKTLMLFFRTTEVLTA